MLASKISRTPYKVNFMLTAACNSRCTTCNIWKEFQENPNMIKDELRYEEIVRIFKRLPRTVSWLSLTGGEPFLRKDLLKIIKAAIRFIPNLRLIGIPCNGLLQKRVLDLIGELVKMKNHPDIIITFSIDGPAKIHDKVRGVKGGFKKTWDTYRKARRLIRDDKDFQVGIETTVSAQNVDSVMPFMRKLLEHNHKLAVTIAHDAYLYKNENDDSVSPRKKLAKIESMIRMLKSHLSFFNPQTLIERQYLRKIPEFLKHPKKRIVACEALKSSFAIDPNGNLLPCLMWGEKLVNVRDYNYDIGKVWHSRRFEAIRDSIKKENCPNCWTPCEAYQSIFWAILKLRMIIR